MTGSHAKQNTQAKMNKEMGGLLGEIERRRGKKEGREIQLRNELARIHNDGINSDCLAKYE